MAGRRRGLPWPLIRRDYGLRLRRSLPSTTDALNRAVHEILEVAARHGCLCGGRTDLEIALREALANALIHGNGYGEQKRIFLRCYGSRHSGMVIVVRDEGLGFNPKKVPDPRKKHRRHLHHGRGLFLMRRLMDHIEFRRGGCEVLLYKAYRSTDEN